jgi:integrase
MWVENRYSYPNNFKYITKPKSRVSKTEMQIWSKEEFDTFIQAVDNPTYKMLFIMLFYTGRRKSEVLALSPKDINIKEGTINFSKTLTSKTIDGSLYKITSTKNEKKQISYICKPLKEALNKYNPQSPFFFGGDRPIPYTTLSRAFDTYISKSSVKPIRIHDLRHSFVSRAISLGGNLTVVARLISDSLEQVVRTYGHLVENDLKSLIEKL